MDTEIEDIIGEVKCTNSQKSVATSNVYSLDFTDSSSDQNNSSGKETYVIERDNSDESEQSFHLDLNESTINLRDACATSVKVHRGVYAHCEPCHKTTKATATSLSKCSIVAQETFTQTSKTIIELAENEGALRKSTAQKTHETQTSFISITENKTVEYRIELSGAKANITPNGILEGDKQNETDYYNINRVLTNSLEEEEGSSKFPISETEYEKTDDVKTETCSEDEMIRIIREESKENILSDEMNEAQYENTSDFDESESDIEEDSLIANDYYQHKIDDSENSSDTSEVAKSVDNEVEDLYNKLSQRINIHTHENVVEYDTRHFGTLTPLTEESAVKKESVIDITPNVKDNVDQKDRDKDVLFTNKAGVNVKVLLKDDEKRKDKEQFKLPPIKSNQSCPSSPHFSFLFSVNTNNNKSVSKAGTWASYYNNQKGRPLDRWEIGTKDLASGESPLISGRSDPIRRTNDSTQLPPIHIEGHIKNNTGGKHESHITCVKTDTTSTVTSQEPISIHEKIKELKMSNKVRKPWTQNKYGTRTESRSVSPGSSCSPNEPRLCDAAEKGCDALCVELLRRLRSSSWFEIADTLEELPTVLEKFWGVITENRIADLIRQVSSYVESPRTQVARSACCTLAAILKNTNYTKKPDFYEAMTVLLTKTGSFSRPVRHAANVALDNVVCGVELSHAITALCVHGVSHKSALVRCASARLLVVCAALAGGGRELLRARPPSAAAARRHALRSLAALLDDKSTETRKYAERLYGILRPLTNFEAYYLTDVEVELASKQMKKYDQLLLCGPPNKETR